MKGQKSGIKMDNHYRFKSKTSVFMNVSTLVYLHGSIE